MDRFILKIFIFFFARFLTLIFFCTESLEDFYTVNNTDSQRVTCKLCQKDLSRRSFDTHMSIHHPGVDKRRVKCDLCTSYVLKTKLGKHLATMHGSGFACRVSFCRVGTFGFINVRKVLVHKSCKFGLVCKLKFWFMSSVR